MSIGSLGIIGGLAAAPQAQRAAESDKVSHETANEARTVDAKEQAERVAGIGQTEEDSQAADRDADGRRPWEAPPNRKVESTETEEAPPVQMRSKDPTGACGGAIDLMG